MIPGLSGSALSHDALTIHGYTSPPDAAGDAARKELSRWFATIAHQAGPAWSARQVFDAIATPFCQRFGLQVVPTSTGHDYVHGQLLVHTSLEAVLLATGYGQDASTAWRESVRLGIGADVRWCFCFNGPSLRIFDAARTYSRRYAQLDLAFVASEPHTFAVVWRLLSATRIGSVGRALDEATGISERHRTDVRDALQSGVHQALAHLTTAFVTAGRRRKPHGASTQKAFDESLVVVYRVLFLLFAEARGLVPMWHPLFRESYTIEALRPILETRAQRGGVWPALQAIARLAHRGCRAGTLRVPPFNGRLFSPVHAPLADSLPLDEALVRQALAALTTRPSRDGLQRIAFADLGVEHLGGVYERVLDFDIETVAGHAQLVPGGTRKSTGSFYTPRSLTEHLVRRTLAPLLSGRDPDAILRLRIVDPAMGSGAFLVAACRYLAYAYEMALVREGVVAPCDLTETERAGFRRTVAQRCLYGVDRNPMAVQLARLSLWLATLSGDRPLTFFDHHLRTGNSLVGARVDDIIRSGMAGGRPHVMPLFDDNDLERDVRDAVASHLTLREGQEDTLEQVREKERLFARISSDAGPLARWKRVADLWCAAWFEPSVRRLSSAIYRDLLEATQSLPDAVSAPLLESASAAAQREHFFHWTLEFPDVFATGDAAGFDAVVGNPPWDVLRAAEGRSLTRFSRESGCYRQQGRGHANLYQLFVERSLALLRRGGRLGLVLPSGFTIDHGCAALRRQLLDRTSVDALTVVDNREALFPIHRGLKFVMLTATKGGCTTALPCRFGMHAASDFDRLPESGVDPHAVTVGRELLEQISGEQLAIPEFCTQLDATLAARLALANPPAAAADGWNLRFGRELNATDDREHFTRHPEGNLPILEGKHVQPFQVDIVSSRQFIDRGAATRLLPSRPFQKARLAYRDVAAATNRLTLIAAVLPPDTVTTHTLFCLKTPLDEDAQHALCGLFNSFVANYLVRMRVSTHVTVSIIERLPLPVLDRGSHVFHDLVMLARRLATHAGDINWAAAHQALVARLYGLTAAELEHVLDTFPLVDRAERDRALQLFVDRL